MSDYEFSEIPFGSAAYRASVALRNEILRAPLGLELKEGDLEKERSDYHLACESKGEIIGCLILSPESQIRVKLRQVAVSSRFQRLGIGRALTEFAEEFARQHVFTEIRLHARATAVGFYEKLGYERVGEPFEEISLLHWEMQKRL